MKGSNVNIENIYKNWLKDKETERRWRSKPLSYFEFKKVILLDSCETVEYIAEYSIETPLNCMEFCKDVLQSTWKEKENFISEDCYASCIYALTVIKDRWIENEHTFINLNNNNLLKIYIETFFGNHFPEDEVETNPLYDVWYEKILQRIIPPLKIKSGVYMKMRDISHFIQKDMLNPDSPGEIIY